MRNKGSYKVLIALLLVVLIFPLVNLLIQAFQTEGKGVWSVLEHSTLWGKTIGLSLLVVALSTIWAFGAAYVLARFPSLLKTVFEWMLMLPLAIPPFIMAYCYKQFLGPFGTAHSMFDVFFETDHYLLLALCLSFSLFPYSYIFLKSTLHKQTPLYSNASAVLGVAGLKRFFTVILPLNRKAIFGGGIVIAMEVFNNYGAVKYLGLETVSTFIIDQYNPMQPDVSLGMSFWLVLLVLLLLQLESKWGANARFEGVASSAYSWTEQRKPVVAFWAYGAVFILVLLSFLLPVLLLISWAWRERAYSFDDELLSAVSMSATLGLLSAAAIVLVALLFQVGKRYTKGRGKRGLQWLTLLSNAGYAVPGAVLGLSILLILSFISHQLGVLITGGVGILVYAYLIRFLSIGNNGIQSAYAKIPNELMSASQVLGKSWWHSFWAVDFKLLAPSLLGIGIIAFVDVLKELPLTMMFQSFNFETLALTAYGLMETDGGVYKASIPSLLIICLGLIPVYLIHKKVK